MRTISLFVAVFAAGLLLATPAAAGEWSLSEWMTGDSPWSGHGIGSSYTERQTMEMPGMPDMPDMPNVPGMPRGGKTVTEIKKTLTQITETEYVLKVETTTGGRTITSEEREPRKRSGTATPTDGGQGTVTIQGTSYSCTLKKVSDFTKLVGGSMRPPGGRGGRSMTMPSAPATIWEHADLGVLKIEATMSMMGQTNTMTWAVTKLSVTHTVGAHSFKCREMTMAHSMMPGGKTVMLSSRTFPGGNLTFESVMNMMGMKRTMKHEVTAYDKKPLGVTTGAR